MLVNARSRNKSTNGFVGVVFLAVALIGIVVAAIATMNRGPTNSTSHEAVKVAALTLINAGMRMKDELTPLLANPSNVIGDPNWNEKVRQASARATVHNRVFGPDSMGAEVKFLPYYGIYIPGLPYPDSTQSVVVVVEGVDREVCMMANHIISKDSLTQEPASVDWEVENPDMEIRFENCIKNNNNNYDFYVVIEPYLVYNGLTH